MSVRVGESWTTSRGHRRWVSMSLGDLLAGGLVTVIVVGPLWLVWILLLAELWVCAELLLLSLRCPAFSGQGLCG